MIINKSIRQRETVCGHFDIKTLYKYTYAIIPYIGLFIYSWFISNEKHVIQSLSLPCFYFPVDLISPQIDVSKKWRYCQMICIFGGIADGRDSAKQFSIDTSPMLSQISSLNSFWIATRMLCQPRNGHQDIRTITCLVGDPYWKNPAPVDMVNLRLFTGFYTSQVVVGISSINIHQQYERLLLLRVFCFYPKISQVFGMINTRRMYWLTKRFYSS